MLRRDFLLAATSLIVSSSAKAAVMDLGPSTNMGVPRRSWVEHPSVVMQECPQWCWAASASMIFASHGHPIDQKKIVERIFGPGLPCAPAMVTGTIVNVLSSTWEDDSGAPFRSTIIAAYDPMNNVNAINNAFIVDHLANDRPLLYCNTHHAMVVVAADYFATPYGPNVQAVGVIDPFPTTLGFHPLTPPEIVATHNPGGQMTFLAAVDVQRL